MKWLIVFLAVCFMVTPAMAGEDPYIAIVGTDCVALDTNRYGQLCNVGFISFANPFYFSPKHRRFMYSENTAPFFIPTAFGSFPPVDQYTRAGGTGTEQFRSQMQVIQPEVCDNLGTVGGVGQFTDHGNRNAVTRAGNSGWYEWYIRLPKKPTGEINLVLQCGVLKPNTWAFYEYDAVSLCAAETGERVGDGMCSRQEVNPGTNPLIIGALPKIRAVAYPGPNNSFTPFNLTAFRNPGTYNPFSAGVLVNNAAGQILDGIATGTRILLKSCMDKTIVTKLPVTGQVNANAQVETDLEMGDLIYVRMDVPRQNTVDIYCHAQSVKVAGIGESPF